MGTQVKLHDANEYTISKKNTVVGGVYITKDDRLIVYLGADSKNMDLFYLICPVHTVWFKQNGKDGKFVDWVRGFTDYDRLWPMYASCMANLVQGRFSEEALFAYKSWPKLTDTLSPKWQYPIENLITWVNLSNEDEDTKREVLFALSHAMKATMAVKAGQSTKSCRQEQKAEMDARYIPVSAKDLEIGRIYITGTSTLGTGNEGWRCSYIYLGRVGPSFAWLFIGGGAECLEDRLKIERAIQIRCGSDLDVTKNNKKVYVPITFGAAREYRATGKTLDRLNTLRRLCVERAW